MKRFFVMVALGLAPVIAMAQAASSRVLTPAEAQSFAMLATAKEKAARDRLKTLSKEQIYAELQHNLSDVTKIIYQPGFGVYVEYTAADGQDRMWFPGNTRAVRGVWSVRDRNGASRVCFHYFKSTNVVTGEFESTECSPPEQTLSDGIVIEKRHGDVFNLLSDHIPYRKAAFEVPAWP